MRRGSSRGRGRLVSSKRDFDDPLRIADSVLFQLGIAVNLSTGVFYRRFAKRYGLSLVDWQVLLLAASRPGISPKELSELLAVDKMTITRAVRRLLARGRIRTSTNRDDRRRLTLTITPKGASIVHATLPDALAHQAQALRDLSEAQRLMLAELVLGLITTLRKLAATEGAESETGLPRPLDTVEASSLDR